MGSSSSPPQSHRVSLSSRTWHLVIYFLDCFPEKLLVIWRCHRKPPSSGALIIPPSGEISCQPPLFSKSMLIHCLHPGWADMLICLLKDFFKNKYPRPSLDWVLHVCPGKPCPGTDVLPEGDFRVVTKPCGLVDWI